MNNLLEKGTRCLIVQSQFSALSFWNYLDVCKIVGAKYPASPLGLMTVAALLPQQWEFRLVDANVEPLLDEHFAWADLVCTGGMLPQQKGVLSVIERAHQNDCLAVVGGPDPSSQPDLYQSADFLVHGEGEVTIPMFIDDLGKNYRTGEYKSEIRADMTKAVVPRFDLIRFRDYIHVGIQYSRGCPFNCEFCDIIELYGRKPRTKTTDQIIKELQALYDLGYRGHVDFVDDNFIGNKSNVKQVLPAIREWSQAHNYPFYFSTESSLNLAEDESLLKMMKNADFRFVFIGIETPENDVLKQTQKMQNMNKGVEQAIKKISYYGMVVNGGFIVGFDNEKDETADKMIRCIEDSGICMAMLGTLYALPNTQLTKRLKREGRLFEDTAMQRDRNNDIDQMTSGLNFITVRPRLDILKDYVRILEHIYDPGCYYQRATRTCLLLRQEAKFKPGIVKMLSNLKAFLKICKKVGFNKTTGWFYWKMLFTVLLKNPKALEQAVTLAAMFIHFNKQSKFIIDHTNRKIKIIERALGKKSTAKQEFEKRAVKETPCMASPDRR